MAKEKVENEKVEVKSAEPVAQEFEVEKNEEVKVAPVQEKVEGAPEVAEQVRGPKREDPLANWAPKTNLGRNVFVGKVLTMDEIFKSGKRIVEPQIVDKLVPDLKNEIVLIGGRGGKGGGVQRIPVRITAAMHKSGRRFHMGAMVVVGNEDGIVGIGQGRAPETRDAINKGIEKAKLNVIPVKRGCGSWECGCGMQHSVPYKISGKSGSVFVELIPAPKGVGIVAQDEAKKVLRLAGIRDVWVKTRGNTGMRINLINAIYNAMKKLYTYERGAE